MNKESIFRRIIFANLFLLSSFGVLAASAQDGYPTPAALPTEDYAADYAPVSSKSSSDSVTISAMQLQQMQRDLKAVQDQLAKDKEKAAKKAEEEKEKKFKSPNTKLSARFFLDGATATGNDVADVMAHPASGSQFRQIRLTWKGSMYDMIEYALSVDFGGSDYAMKDVYGGFYNLPCGVSFRAGHFKEPWSMEELMGAAETPLMEKSAVNSLKSLAGGRNNGFMFHNWHDADRISWAVGMFAASMKEKSLSCTGTTENFAMTARLTLLPYYEQWCDGRETLWHIGLGYTYRKYDRTKADDRGTTVSLRPDNAIQSAVIAANNGGVLWGLESLNAVQLETAWVRGSFTLEFEQAFYFLNDLQCKDEKANLYAGYLQASYILTGEGRNYKKGGGFLGGVTPECPFVRVCTDEMSVFSGPGAWEIAYRISWADTGELATPSDGSYIGYGSKTGFMLANTLGLNWYLNKNTRMMFNYSAVKADYESPDRTGWYHVFATRFQVVF